MTSNSFMDTGLRFGYRFPRFPLPPNTSFPEADTWKCCSQLPRAEREEALWSRSEQVAFGLRPAPAVATSTVILGKGSQREQRGQRSWGGSQHGHLSRVTVREAGAEDRKEKRNGTVCGKLGKRRCGPWKGAWILLLLQQKPVETVTRSVTWSGLPLWKIPWLTLWRKGSQCWGQEQKRERERGHFFRRCITVRNQFSSKTADVFQNSEH